MVKLIIRDDDCNYFTNPEDLKQVYRSLCDFPITYAVVPAITDVKGGCPETNGNTIPRYIGMNKKLVEYLKEEFSSKNCDIVLHGITHGYEYNEDGSMIPEMVWRDKQGDLTEEIAYWKHDFEKLFNGTIKCFVAPSNTIGKNAIKAIYNNGLNFSGIISVKYERHFSIRSILNYIRRVYVRAVYGFAHPGILDYGTHKEVNANNHLDYDYLVSLFNYCDKRNYPMAINVHYWHMRDFPEKYEGFFKFIEYAIGRGAVPTRLSDLFV